MAHNILITFSLYFYRYPPYSDFSLRFFRFAARLPTIPLITTRGVLSLVVKAGLVAAGVAIGYYLIDK